MTKWISVKDEWPPSKGLILLLHKISGSLYSFSIYEGVPLKDSVGENKTITHWMPLPKPPEN